MAGDPGRPARADRGPYRVRQDPCRVSRGDRRASAARAGRQPPGRDANRLRLAIEGAVERYQAQPRGAARRCARSITLPRVARCRDPHLGAHRRHAAGRASTHGALAAACRRNNTGVALHPARLRVGPQNAGDDAYGDRRRDPRTGAEQARLPPGAFARTPRSPLYSPAVARRPLRHPEAHRESRAFSRRRPP